jgi:two-component system chemotaxis sensor kinase CheA
LQQILKKLLSNAFKFTKKGSVIMEIHPLIRRNGLPGVVFSVADTGIGIPQDKQELIFQAFQQVDGSFNREYGGTGLGLSICRETAHLLQGEIMVESKEKKGSKFSLVVSDYQLSEIDEGAAARSFPIFPEGEEGEKDRPICLSGKKILLIDNDVRNVFAMTSVLELRGMEVIFAENGMEALELLKNNGGIDLVIIDIQIPGIDGYDTMRQIRQFPLLKNLPIIVLTTTAKKEEREKSMAAGASDYIVKPVDPNQIATLITEWLY